MKTRWFVIVATALALGIAGSANAAGDAAKGKTKAKSCAACHGKDGKGKKMGKITVPSLVKPSESKIVKALQDFKSGKRKNKQMSPVAKKLSDKDIANLAAYYASL